MDTVEFNRSVRKGSFMKSILFLLFAGSIAFASPSLEWQIQQGLASPESVYYDANTRSLYVSNIGVRGSGARDGNGWIQKVSPAGNIIKEKWAVGLNDPKGMRALNGELWVADIDRVVAIDTATGNILRSVAIPGAKFLNDVALDTNGDVYISDTIGRKIYRVRGTQLEVFVEGDSTESPNGLLVHSGKLIVAAWGLAGADWSTPVPGRVFSFDLATKTKTLITRNPLGHLDGLEQTADGSLLTSDYGSGKLYKITADGQVTELSIPPIESVADIGYIPDSSTLVVPYTGENLVKAFNLDF